MDDLLPVQRWAARSHVVWAVTLLTTGVFFVAWITLFPVIGATARDVFGPSTLFATFLGIPLAAAVSWAHHASLREDTSAVHVQCAFRQAYGLGALVSLIPLVPLDVLLLAGGAVTVGAVLALVTIWHVYVAIWGLVAAHHIRLAMEATRRTGTR